MGGEPIGCLGNVLRLFGISPRRSAAGTGDSLPYRVRDDFLSPAERSFLGVLQQAVDGRGVIFAKVRVADLLYVPKGAGSIGFENRIRSKHVDFVLCAPATLKPLAAIELDDASHSRPDRKERDEFLGEAFTAAGLAHLRFTAKRQYEPRAIAADLESVLAGEDPIVPVPKKQERGTGAPNCPKCGSPMIVKTASRGLQSGQPFYACPNFPKCRATVPITD